MDNKEMGRLAASLEGLSTSVEHLRVEMHENTAATNKNAGSIQRLDERCIGIQEQLSNLDRSVLLGNGQPALIEQVAQLHTEVEQHSSDIQLIEEKQEARANSRELTRGQLIAGIIVAVGTFLTSAAALAAAALK